MTNVTLIDTTVRDGNQSNWGATGLDTGMMLQIAPVMERVGFEAIDFTTSTHMAVAVRFKKEDPWERLRLFKEATPNTPLSFLTTGMRFISWEKATEELMEFAFRLLVKNGISRFAVMDPMNNVPAMLNMAGITRKAGGNQIVAALTFTLSPLHDDAHWVEKTKALCSSGKFDKLYVKDPGGLISPERAAALFPALKVAAGGVPLEFHSHTTIGLAAFSYLEAAQNGAPCLHTSASSAANGTGQPAMSPTIANLRDMGMTVDVDDEAVAEMDAYFTALAAAEGLSDRGPGDYDRRYFQHQIPGGVMGTMMRQLKETRREHLLPAVLEEVVRVRAEFGYPIMVTPFSQLVATQAMLNVTSNERYQTVPDEVTRYVLGRFGTPAMPMDANVEDRIRSSKRAKELEAEATMGSIDELRAKIGKQYSDEEFLLRATMPADQVDAMKAAGPARRGYDPKSKPVMDLVRELTARKGLGRVKIEKAGFKLELNGGQA
ncbi:biotin carboxyl carrier protein [Pseudoprimorskyibacter insulae]|uniref:2-oxoglutarate carboxylase large subunit n=1 Tax=Pseudoprimorskyibacter insulae TaxID=1695997 RepID=A0A2R8AU04_9RHOB|nr:biotin carboxyl carrier protein [Pseudoprimorskyibacter insulae]SPF79518.1 2-oxoglutarate carboxylase large subunit [Pseudoprimorskyibacter insulae]